jgi:hypothetical protein
MSLNKSHVIRRLKAARSVIANERWMKGELCNLSKSGQVSVCAVGAIIAADPNVKVTGYGEYSGTYNEELYSWCVQELDDDVQKSTKFFSIVEYNDSRVAKDKRYVLRQFDRTINRLENASS